MVQGAFIVDWLWTITLLAWSVTHVGMCWRQRCQMQCDSSGSVRTRLLTVLETNSTEHLAVSNMIAETCMGIAVWLTIPNRRRHMRSAWCTCRTKQHVNGNWVHWMKSICRCECMRRCCNDVFSDRECMCTYIRPKYADRGFSTSTSEHTHRQLVKMHSHTDRIKWTNRQTDTTKQRRNTNRATDWQDG